MFYVYVIYSLKSNTYYIGTTDDVARRLEEHNSKFYSKAFTSKGIPWELKLSYLCQNSNQAYKLEIFLKRMKFRKFIEKIIDNQNILNDICQNKL